jgi:hypothetical protein
MTNDQSARIESLEHHLREVIGCAEEYFYASHPHHSLRSRLLEAVSAANRVLETKPELKTPRAKVDEALDIASEIAGRRFGMSWRAEELADLELKIASLLLQADK